MILVLHGTPGIEETVLHVSVVAQSKVTML